MNLFVVAVSGLVIMLLTRRLGRIFTKLTPRMYCGSGTEMNALNFGVKSSHFKVTVE